MTHKAQSVAYVVVDAYPAIAGDMFPQNVGAIVGCWVSEEAGTEAGGVLDLAKSKLLRGGWIVGKVVTTELVSPLSYAEKPDGKEYFEQALQDGFVAHFHLRRRETVGDSKGVDLETGFAEFLRKTQARGVVSLVPGGERGWAVGVTPDGDEFVPMWGEENDVTPWAGSWPGSQAQRVPTADLITRVLDQLCEDDMWVGLGLSASSITMFHPLALRDGVVQQAGPRP